MKKESCRSWAREEFRSLNLGDVRRHERTVSLAMAVAKTPGGRITRVVRSSAEQEAAFRWVRNPAVSEQALMTAISSATVRRTTQLPYAFVAVDQSSIGLVDKKKAKGFGHVGRGGQYRKARGLQAMSALAVRPDGGVLGLVGQQWWARSDKPSPENAYDKRPIKERESSLWLSCIQQTLEAFEDHGTKCRPWLQLDRAADAFHVLTLAHDRGIWLTVRSCYNRLLATEDKRYLRSSLPASTRAGFTELKLSKQRCKRLGRSHRQPIRLALSFTEVPLRLTDSITKDQRDLNFHVVRVREHRPPENVKRLEWWLLTTYPVTSLQDAELVLHGYTQRWRVEEFHRTWKSGACAIESSQLRSRRNFQRWATLLAAVATRIERLKFLARNRPDTPAEQVLSRDEIDAAILVTKTRKFKRGDDLNIQQAVHLIAVAGGYTGNTKQGPPGSVTIRRGLERIELIALGMAMAKK